MNKKKIFMIAPFCYGVDRSICDAFRNLGFDVFLKQNRKKMSLFEKASLELTLRFPRIKPVLNKSLKFYLQQDNQDYLQAIKKFRPDLLFVIKGERIFPHTLRYIKDQMKIPCVAYIWDCPFYSYTGQFADDFRKENFAAGMHLYEHVFVYDPYYVEELKERGLASVTYLPLATSCDEYREIDVSKDEREELGYDICFVGSPFPNRIAVLDALADFDLGVFGDGWAGHYKMKNPPPYYKGKATGEKVLKIYNSSKLVLNIHDPETRSGLNTRTFDILASGAFELVDYRPELRNLFSVGEEIVPYNDIPHLRQLISYYLSHPDERASVSRRGRLKTINSHTWYNRLSEVVSILNKKGLL